MVISSGHLDGKDRLVLYIMLALTGAGILWVCLPSIIGSDLHANSFWVALMLAFIVIPTLCVIAFSCYFKSQSVVLLPSKPPMLVTTTTWFGKYVSTVEEKLEGAAWVQVSRDWAIDGSPAYFSVEIVQPGNWATIIRRYEESREALELAQKKCTEIASFLGLEDKGYRG